MFSGQTVAPELVQVPAALGVEPSPHFEPVGLDQVEGPQQSVEPGDDPQAILRPQEIRLCQAGGIEAPVDVTLESQKARFGVLSGERRAHRLKALVIEIGQRVTELHQFGESCGIQSLAALHEDGDVVLELRPGRWQPWWSRGQVEGLCR